MKEELLSTLEVVEQIREYFYNTMKQASSWDDKDHALKTVKVIVGDMLDKTVDKLKQV